MVTDLDRPLASSPPEVDPDVLRLLAGCTSELRPREGEVVLALHQRLLELAPAVTRMASSGRPMCQRLITAVLDVARAGQGSASTAPAVQQVGRENYLDGFPSEQYHAVTHAVLHAVRAVFPGEWSSPLSSAWVEYLIWLRAHLQIGADAQRAEDATRGVPRVGAVAPAPSDGLPGAPGAHDPFALPGAAPSLPPSATIDDDLDDDEDEDEPSYGSLMMSMTLNPKRDKRDR